MSSHEPAVDSASRDVHKEACQAQCLLHLLTRTLPKDFISVLDVTQLHSAVHGAALMSAHLQQHLRQRGICLTPPEDRPTCDTVILMDIEGTITPLPFVRQVLFPAAERRLESYTAAHYPSDPEFCTLVKAMAAQSADLHAALTADSAQASAAHTEDSLSAVHSEIVKHARAELQRQPVRAEVKQLQGRLWMDACRCAGVSSVIFRDVYDFIRRMASSSAREEKERVASGHARVEMAVYSTGSVEAQRALLGSTSFGDLNPFISAYFDPGLVGSKVSPESYTRIRQGLLSAKENRSNNNLRIVFLTDNPMEVVAAEQSGAIDVAVLCLRPLNSWLTEDQLGSLHSPYLCSFKQLCEPDAPVDFDDLVTQVRQFL